MTKTFGKVGSAVLEALLPSARGQACTDSYCQQSGSRRRCCKVCPGGVVACTPWVSGSCAGVTCPQ
ncbi:MAG: hypothetical protein ACR2N4_11120 [Jatrophihabitans sp.]